MNADDATEAAVSAGGGVVLILLGCALVLRAPVVLVRGIARRLDWRRW